MAATQFLAMHTGRIFGRQYPGMYGTLYRAYCEIHCLTTSHFVEEISEKEFRVATVIDA